MQEGKIGDEHFTYLVNNYDQSNTEELVVNISKYIAIHIKNHDMTADFNEWNCIDEIKFDMYAKSDKCCSIYTIISVLTGGLGLIACCYNFKQFDDKYRFPALFSNYADNQYGMDILVRDHWKYLRFWDIDNLCKIFGVLRKFRISTRETGLIDDSEGYDKLMIDTITNNLERIKCIVYNILKYEDVPNVSI
jgi:hypothetical protein